MRLLASHTLWVWTLSFVSILCMLLRPWRVREAIWIAGGAILLIATRLIPLSLAAHAIAEGTDVYLFLTGMMLLAELARHEGVFDWVANIAVSHARGSSSRLFWLIYLTGAAVTTLLSNDATAVVLTPAVLAAVRRAQVEPKPYLLACALVANAASFMLPVSNPANLVVYGSHLPQLGTWLRIFLLPSLLSIATTYLCLRLLSRKELIAATEPSTPSAPLSAAGRVALAGLIGSAVVLLIASGLGMRLGAPTCAAAVAATILVNFKDRDLYKHAIREITWSILPLIAGLFIIVEALNHNGLLKWMEQALRFTANQPKLASDLAASGGVALLANIMNNLPVALAAGTALNVAPRLAHAILIGVNLGPNLSVTGSLATVLWLIVLRREKVEITAWEFFKVGLVVMPAALLASLCALWLTA